MVLLSGAGFACYIDETEKRTSLLSVLWLSGKHVNVTILLAQAKLSEFMLVKSRN